MSVSARAPPPSYAALDDPEFDSDDEFWENVPTWGDKQAPAYLVAAHPFTIVGELGRGDGDAGGRRMRRRRRRGRRKGGRRGKRKGRGKKRRSKSVSRALGGGGLGGGEGGGGGGGGGGGISRRQPRKTASKRRSKSLDVGNILGRGSVEATDSKAFNAAPLSAADRERSIYGCVVCCDASVSHCVERPSSSSPLAHHNHRSRMFDHESLSLISKRSSKFSSSLSAAEKAARVVATALPNTQDFVFRSMHPQDGRRISAIVGAKMLSAALGGGRDGKRVTTRGQVSLSLPAPSFHDSRVVAKGLDAAGDCQAGAGAASAGAGAGGGGDTVPHIIAEESVGASDLGSAAGLPPLSLSTASYASKRKHVNLVWEAPPMNRMGLVKTPEWSRRLMNLRSRKFETIEYEEKPEHVGALHLHRSKVSAFGHQDAQLEHLCERVSFLQRYPAERKLFLKEVERLRVVKGTGNREIIDKNKAAIKDIERLRARKMQEAQELRRQAKRSKLRSSLESMDADGEVCP